MKSYIKIFLCLFASFFHTTYSAEPSAFDSALANIDLGELEKYYNELEITATEFGNCLNFEKRGSVPLKRNTAPLPPLAPKRKSGKKRGRKRQSTFLSKNINHQCPHCPKSIKSSDAFRAHTINAHTDLNPYSCMFCTNLNFGCRAGVWTHLKKKHGIEGKIAVGTHYLKQEYSKAEIKSAIENKK